MSKLFLLPSPFLTFPAPLALSGLLLTAGCASQPHDIAAAYVSPMQYRNYDCEQIAAEMQRVSSRTTELTGQLDQKADRDNMQMGVGLILFWPTLFFIDGDGPEANEYARLKGEFEALEKTAVQRNCHLEIETLRPKLPEKPKNAQGEYPTGGRQH